MTLLGLKPTTSQPCARRPYPFDHAVPTIDLIQVKIGTRVYMYIFDPSVRAVEIKHTERQTDRRSDRQADVHIEAKWSSG